MKPHKWAKEIKAWADGAEIQCRAVKNTLGITTDWFDAETPQWHDNDTAVSYTHLTLPTILRV